MEEKNNIPYKNLNISNSPIIKYYSNIADPNNENYQSEILKFKALNFPNNNIQIPPLNLNNNQTESSNDSINKEIHFTHKNNNFKLKNDIDITKQKSNDKIREIKKIKQIKPEDLILTKINNNTILRLNPLVYQNESYEFLSSNLYIILKDQLGCKFLQEKLENDTNNALYYFFPALIPNINELTKDAFANYFIQKLFGYLNEEQIEYILKILQPNFLDICIDSHGTRVIQCIMEILISEKLKKLFFDIIKPIFINLINELNGTHIIYKFFRIFPEFSDVSCDIISNNIIPIATNKRGSIFLQNYLKGINNFNNKEKLIQIILKFCLVLIIDPFGNYIIQYLLCLEDTNITLNIINQIMNDITFYSKHKYANYVIEKIFLHANYLQKQDIIQKMSTPEIITDLSFNQQGNFIILKILRLADDNKRNIIINIINSLKPKLEELPNGKIFLKKIKNFSNVK